MTQGSYPIILRPVGDIRFNPRERAWHKVKCEGVDRYIQSLSSLSTPAVAEELRTQSKHQYKI